MWARATRRHGFGWVSAALLLGACNAILGIEDRPAKPSAQGGGGSGGAAPVGGGLPNGSACTEGAECASGQCVDEICCEELCGLCERCNAGGSPGGCTLELPGASAEPECEGGVCDAEGECALGDVRWAKSFGGVEDDTAMAVAIDAEGNVVVASYFFGDVSFGGPILTSAGSRDLVVAKLSPLGNHVWSRRFGGPYWDGPRDLAIRPNGNVVVVGYVGANVDFGGGQEPHGGGQDAFVLELTADGDYVRSQTYGGAGDDGAGSVAVDGDGSLVVAGMTDGTIDFGGEALVAAPPVNSYQYFLAELAVPVSDPGYDHSWSRLVEGGVPVPNQVPVPAIGLAVDGEGNVFVGGNFQAFVGLGGEEHGATGGDADSDAFVAKLSPAGEHLWSTSFGSEGDDCAAEIAVDSAGRTYAAGFAGGDVDLGSTLLPGRGGGTDCLLVRLDSDGQVELATLLGSEHEEQVMGLGLDGRGNVLLTGHYSFGPTTLGGGALPYAGDEEVFVAKLAAGSAAFTLLWSYGFIGPLQAHPRAAAVGADGAMAFCGPYAGRLTVGEIALESAGDRDAFVAVLAP